MSNHAENLFAGQYRILRKLGTDSFGSYYDVEHNELGARYVLKAVPFRPGLSLSDAAIDGFVSGCRPLTALRHPNVARVCGVSFDEATQNLYFVSDMVTAPNGDVHVLSDLEGIDEFMVYTWAKDLVGALDYIHAHGFIHGNIRMDNILINGEYHAVLGGLGMTSLFEDPVRSCVELPKSMSPHYAAPEVRESGSISAASDVYSVGAILVRLLTGSWFDEDPLALLRLPKGQFDWVTLLQKMLASVESRPEEVGPLLAKLKIVSDKPAARPSGGKPTMSLKKKKRAAQAKSRMAMRTSSYRTDGGEASVGTIVFRLVILAGIAVAAVYAACHFIRQNRDALQAQRMPRASATVRPAVEPTVSSASSDSMPSDSAPVSSEKKPSGESMDDLFGY